MALLLRGPPPPQSGQPGAHHDHVDAGHLSAGRGGRRRIGQRDTGGPTGPAGGGHPGHRRPGQQATAAETIGHDLRCRSAASSGITIFSNALAMRA